MDDFEQEIKAIFLEEAKQLLDAAEGDSLALAKGLYSTDSIDKLFRLAHTFKGSAKAVGFESLSQIAHHFEGVLDKLLKGHLTPTALVCRGLLEAIDALRTFTQGLTQNLAFEFPNYLKIIESLERLRTQAEPKEQANPIEPAIPKHAVDLSQIERPAPLRQKHVAPAKQAPSEDMIRISAQKLDRLINMIGELKVHRQILVGSVRNFVTDRRDENLTETGSSSWGTEYIDKIVNEVHDLSMALRMTPIRPVFQKMQRIIWDSGSTLGKEVQLISLGEEVELDKVIVDRIGDSLTHLIRNAVDHGIEPPEERKELGKPKNGTITLIAELQENQVMLTISDDGYGLNREKIHQKALEKGLIQKSQRYADDEIYNMIFEPGFSTRSEVTELSGRGFGLDIVRQLLQEIGGTIEIETVTGKGTKFNLSLPLILSVIQGLVVEVGKTKYIIPLSQIIETIDLNKYTIELGIDQTPIFTLRGEVLPILNLRQMLHGKSQEIPQGSKSENGKKRLGLVVGVHGKKITFEVDHVLESQPMALKPLGLELQGIVGITAGAILGDGEPALVLNLKELIPDWRLTHVNT